MMDVIFSIDIGLSGGIAMFEPQEVSHPSGGLLRLKEMPTKIVTKSGGKEKKELDIEALKFILEAPRFHEDYRVAVVFEDVHAFPFQGAVSVGTLMEQKGIIRGLVFGLGYEEVPVQPKTWQKYFGIVPPDTIKGDTAKKTTQLRKKWIKEQSLEIARSYFPDKEDMLVKDAHGLSDALLIGLWYSESSHNVGK